MPAVSDSRFKALTFSRRLAQTRQIAEALGFPVGYAGPSGLLAPFSGPVTHIVGWGTKSNTDKARHYAKDRDLPFWSLEDGFLGYMTHPKIEARRLSVIVDQTGVYYDANSPSDLETLLTDLSWYDSACEKEAEAVLARVRAIGASKYNHAPADCPKSVSSLEGSQILVVDQTAGDQSIERGGATAASFRRMLDTALKDHPASTLLLKVHPDVLLGQKSGHFDLSALPDRVIPVAEDVSPITLIERVDAVYVVTSQFGFEALLHGKPVHVFGVPFYGGWGLTTDHGPVCARRAKGVSLLQLVAAALIKYPTYLDPYLGGQTDIHTILDYLEAEKAMPRLTGRRVFPLNFSMWKRGFLSAFCAASRRYIPIRTRALVAIKWRAGDAVLVWGRKWDELLGALPETVDVWRMEDGFIRSRGLGSDLERPYSLAIDRTGLYYDGRGSSDLETYLGTATFSDRMLERGRRLAAAICNKRVTKYNIGTSAPLDFRRAAAGKPVILVPGQVEGDASLAYGSPVIRRNQDLLRAVRSNHPGAYIVYKPHPDEVSGNREGSAGDPESLADETVTEVDILDCLAAADSVHTLTSLTGFEALLRGKPVTTYGQPFYAGWGLTTDIYPVDRRGRTLPVEALVYGLLCVYARYVDWPSGQPTIPEAIIKTLSDPSAEQGRLARSRFGAAGQLVRKAAGFLKTLSAGF